MRNSTFFTALKSSRIGSAVLLCALGVLLAAVPGSSIRVLFMAAGAVLCILGLTKALTYFSAGDSREFFGGELISGIILVLSGLFLFFRGDGLIGFAGKVIGIALIVTAVGKISSAVRLKKLGFGSSLSGLSSGILTGVLGVILFTRPLGTARSLVVLVGIIVLAVGIINLITAIRHAGPEEAMKSPQNKRREPEIIDAEYTEL